MALPSVQFGPLLRRFRTARGLSQERLALEAEISSRHLSYLETGRASPSQPMVLLLGAALDLPLRDRNGLLQAAGFADAFRDVPLQAPEAASLRRAIGLILEGIEPNGAVASDRAWNVIRMNEAATRLFTLFVDLAKAPPVVTRNALIATLHPAGLRPSIVNFEEVATLLLERLRHETARYAGDPVYTRLRDALTDIPDLPTSHSASRLGDGPFLTIHLRRGDLEARLFTTIATIGTPIDATAEDLRIETYFPADDRTKKLFASLATRA